MEGLQFLYAYLDAMVDQSWKDHNEVEEWGSDTYWQTMGSWAVYKEIRDLVAAEVGEGVVTGGYYESFKIGQKLRALENIFGMLEDLTPEQQETFERGLQGAIEDGPSWLYHRHDPKKEEKEDETR